MHTDPMKKTGKWMLAASWIIAIVLLTLWFDDVLLGRDNPNQRPQSYLSANKAEVVLKPNRQGHYVVSGMINGEAVTFLLDTGATEVSVPAHLQHKLNLQPGYATPVSTANGVVDSLSLVRLVAWTGEAYRVPINEIEIAPEDLATVAKIEGFIARHTSVPA